MGKKKKKTGAGDACQDPAAVVTDHTSHDSSTTTSSSSSSSTTTPTTAPAAAAKVVNVWNNDFNKMKIQAIPKEIPSSLIVCPDGLGQKVAAGDKFAFAIYTSTDKDDHMGRRAIAHRDIQPGTLLLKERGQPWVVHKEHKDKVCHHCAKCLIGQPSKLHCDVCEYAYYCSPTCQEQHAPLHKVECRVLEDLDEISDVALVNVDLVRAALAYIVTKTLQNKNIVLQHTPPTPATSSSSSSSTTSATSSAASSAASSSSSTDTSIDPLSFHCTPADAELLVAHVEMMAEADRNHTKDAASLIMKLLPSEYHVPIESVVDFMGRVNSNCHALTLCEYPSISFGFGLFPLCATFNHSCYPNCIFVNEGSQLCFRVIRPVAKGEELCVNYISLYQSRVLRRADLMTSKRFFCQCRRCMYQPANVEEKRKFEQDVYCGALMCQNKKADGERCTGFYKFQYANPSTNKSASSIDSSETKSTDDESKSTSSTDSSTDVTFELPKVQQVRCMVCQHAGDAVALRKQEAECIEKSEKLLESYGMGIRTPQSIRDEMEAFLNQNKTLLHPNHTINFNLALPLVNCCSALQDHKAKLEYAEKVLAMADNIFPYHFLPIVNYCQAIGDTLKTLINKKTLPKKILQRYQEQRISILERTVESLKVCRGEEHIEVLKAINALNEAKNTKV